MPLGVGRIRCRGVDVCPGAQDVGPISHDGIVESSVEQVWAAFTTSDGLRAWLAPHAEIELKVGGLMRTNHNKQGQLGDAGTIGNMILSFEPQRMISIKVAMRAFFNQGNASTLNQLQRHFAAKTR